MLAFRAAVTATLLSLFAIAAHAQVDLGGGGSAGPLICTSNIAVPKQVRAEGHAELLGDIVVACTGGAKLADGAAVPTVDVTVALASTIVTSRVFGNGLSEALLLIDEPNGQPGGTSTIPFPFNLCSGGALGAADGGCATTARALTVGGVSTTVASTSAVPTTSTVPNVFQATVAANLVTFHGVPLLAPVTAGYARVFRITNLRADATNISGSAAPIYADVTMSGGGIFMDGGPQIAANTFGGFNPAAVRNASNSAAMSSLSLAQCSPSGLTPGAVVRFSEGFGSAFKTRVAAMATVSGASTAPNSLTTSTTFTQNVPGVSYTGSQSGFVLDVSGGTAGLASFGTRLKATFSNLPPGLKIYVSTANINPLGNTGVNAAAGTDLTAAAAAVAAGKFSPAANVTTLAGLMTSEGATAASGGPIPLASATNTAGGVNLFGPLTADANGTATATWEVLLSDPAALESLEFAVFYSWDGSAASNANPVTIAPSFAPTAASFNNSGPIPQFQGAVTAVPFASFATGTCTAGVGLTSSANPSAYRQSVTFTATVSAAGVTPTGSVTFLDGAATLGTVSLTNGHGSFSTSSLAIATHSITAVYSGDTNYPGATSSAISQVVSRAATSTALAISSALLSPGAVATFTASVTSASGIPTGLVTFRDGGSVLGSSPVDGSGVARFSASSLAGGGHSITAAYGGDLNFNASTSGAQFLTVGRNATSIGTPFVKSGTPAPGQVFALAVTVTADGPLLGSVTFRDGGSALGDASVDGAGTAAVNVRLGAGLHPITALYSGDSSNEAAASGTLYLTIKAIPAVTVSVTPGASTAGDALTLTATVAAPLTGAATPTGSVAFTDGSTTLGTGALNASGVATLPLPSGLAAGDHTITASYAGDNSFTAATASVVQHVTKIGTAITFGEGVGGNGFYLTATVTTSSRGPATGLVEFTDLTAGASLGTAALANGAATLALNAPLPAGHMLRAAYSGDATFANSVSPSQVFIAGVNGFSFAAAFAPDAVVSAFGSGLASGTVTAPGLPLSTSLGGVSVQLIDADGHSHDAQLYFVSPGQINFVVPADMPAGSAKLRITTSNGTFTMAMTVARIAPSLTSADGSGSGTAAAEVIRVHGDGTQDIVTPTAAGVPRPAAGERLYLALYGAGLRHAAGPVSCSINGQAVTPLYFGAHNVYPGLDQINLELPAMTGLLKISCSADGATSNTVTLNVQ